MSFVSMSARQSRILLSLTHWISVRDALFSSVFHKHKQSSVPSLKGFQLIHCSTSLSLFFAVKILIFYSLFKQFVFYPMASKIAYVFKCLICIRHYSMSSNSSKTNNYRSGPLRHCTSQMRKYQGCGLYPGLSAGEQKGEIETVFSFPKPIVFDFYDSAFS